MNLASLPGDTLAHIARFNGASAAVLGLWKCGNSALNKKLSEWIDEIDLEDRNLASTSRYPKFLSSLRRLRVLRLIRHGRLAPNTILSQEVQKLSPTLAELTLSCVQVADALVAFPDSQLGLDIEITKATELICWNVASKFPNLVKLAIKRSRESSKHFGYLPATLMLSFPPSLEFIELENAMFHDLHLPELPSLHTLKLRSSSSTAVQWPPQLTRLDLQINIVAPRDKFFYESLPPLLKSIPVNQFCETADDVQSMLPLPSSLEELRLLTVNELPLLSLNWLPSTLTLIEFSTSLLSHVALTAGDLLALPPGLLHLKAYVIDWNSITAYLDQHEDTNYDLFWPRKLRSCDFEEVPELDLSRPNINTERERFFTALPSSLTQLRGLGSIGVDWLPRCFPILKSLYLHGQTRFPEQFPSTLDTLGMRIDYQPDLFSSLRTSSLTSLEISLGARRYRELIPVGELFSCLPQSLKTFNLQIEFKLVVWTPNAFAMLPITLTNLTVRTLLTQVPRPKPSSVLPVLPPNLTSIELSLSEPPSASDLLGMPCYHQLRIIYFEYREYRGTPLTHPADAWPEAAMVDTTTTDAWPSFLPRLESIIQRDKQFPDPRTLKSLQSEKPGKK